VTPARAEASGTRAAPQALEIALIRHGRPRLASSAVAAHELDRWITAYDRAGIDPALPPPRAVRELAESASYLLSSDLPRAVESLRALAPERAAPAERIFREAGLPRLPASPIRLDPQVWAALGRVGWFLGWSLATESASNARRRARSASRELSDLAAAHGSVLLVGHGLFNALIAWELRRAGWRGPLWPTGSYWSAAVYRKHHH
jgi:broad specificity phosphatase PhoE